MILRFLGQSGYLLESGGSRILIDPYFSDIVGRLHGRARLLPIPLPREQWPCDGVICTHNHLDHLDPDTVAGFPDDQAFYTTREGCDALKTMGKLRCAPLTPGDTAQIGEFQICAVHASHSCEAIGLIVRAEGKTLYFSGDTLFDEKLFDIAAYQPDITFICINGRLGNMTTQEALITAKAIGAPVNIPHHYDMFASNSADPYAFSQNIPGGKVLQFNTPYTLEDLL